MRGPIAAGSMRAASILPKEFDSMQISSRSRFARRSRLLALATVGAALALPVSAQADDAFLKLPGPDIAGETIDKVFPNTIPVREFSWGIENEVNIGSSTSGAGAARRASSASSSTSRSTAPARA